MTATCQLYATFRQRSCSKVIDEQPKNSGARPDLYPKVAKDGHVDFIFPGYLLQTPCQSDQY